MVNPGVTQFWHRGQLQTGNKISLELSDPGWLYGATVFSTLRVYQNSLEHPLTAWQAHCHRLQASLDKLGWRSPDWSAVSHGAQQLGTQFPVLRVTVFPDGAELITGRSLPHHLERDQQQGIAAWVASGTQFQRVLPTHKTGNYLPCWFALQAAKEQQAQEAILVDPCSGDWLETSTGNLWGWADGQWWTPPLQHPTSKTDRILPGVVRSQVISWLKWQNERISETWWTFDLIAQLEALAYSNSIRQVVPIHTVFANPGSEGKAIYSTQQWTCPQPSQQTSEGRSPLTYRRFDVNHPALKKLQRLFKLKDIERHFEPNLFPD